MRTEEAVGTHSLGRIHLLRSDHASVHVHRRRGDAILVRQAFRSGRAAPRDLPAHGVAFRPAVGVRQDGAGRLAKTRMGHVEAVHQWCFLLLALFYGLIDMLRWRAWAFPFVVIGANALF